MNRKVLGWKCRGAGPFISLPDYVYSFRAMEPSSFPSVSNAPSPHHAQQQRQQGNHRTNGGSMNSLAAGTESKTGSFGGPGQNSSSRIPSSPSFQFGSLDLDDGIPSYATNNPRNDFPELSNARKAPVSALQTVTASLDGEQLGKGSKLGSKASPLPVEGTSAIVQNTNSQVPPKYPPQHWQSGSGWPLFGQGGQGEANKDSVPSPSPFIDDFPPLSDASSARNRGPSRQGRGRGRAEQVQTHVPREPQQLKQAGDGRDGRQNRPGRDPAWEKAESINALGRTLTKILRHKAVELRLAMSSDGYVDVQDILKLTMKTASNRPLTSHSIADVKQAVQQDQKQRFGIKDENGRLFIRASQGHTMESVKSEHLLKPIISADEVPVCVHGTYRRYLDLIFKGGLKRMNRNHIHFASGVTGSEDVISGMRSTCEVLIYLNVNMALADGMKLYISENKVILTDGFGGVVPPEYFKKVLSLPDMKPIARRPA